LKRCTSECLKNSTRSPHVLKARTFKFCECLIFKKLHRIEQGKNEAWETEAKNWEINIVLMNSEYLDLKCTGTTSFSLSLILPH
jgi:hypothetical protein